MAKQPDPTATAEVDEVPTLSDQRRMMENKRKTVFGTYLDCSKKYFERAYPNCIFQDTLLQVAVQNWKKMPESRKSHYYQLNKEHHEFIDMQCHVLERRAIALRPGVRDYGGRPIKEPMQESVKELTFNPLLWYMLDKHAEDWLQISDYNWEEDVGKLYRNAAKNWPSLSKQEQERFVNEAKADRICYFTERINEIDNDQAVRKILASKLKEWIVKEL